MKNLLILLICSLPAFGQNDIYFPDELTPTAEHLSNQKAWRKEPCTKEFLP